MEYSVPKCNMSTLYNEYLFNPDDYLYKELAVYDTIHGDDLRTYFIRRVQFSAAGLPGSVETAIRTGLNDVMLEKRDYPVRALVKIFLMAIKKNGQQPVGMIPEATNLGQVREYLYRNNDEIVAPLDEEIEAQANQIFMWANSLIEHFKTSDENPCNAPNLTHLKLGCRMIVNMDATDAFCFPYVYQVVLCFLNK